MRTLFFVHTQNYHNFVSTHSDELLYTPYASPGELREQNHAVDVVVFQKLHICAHLGDLLNIDLTKSANAILERIQSFYHHERINLWVFVFIEAAVRERHLEIAR